MSVSGAPITNRRSTPTGWDLVARAPHPRLRPFVRHYCGYAERTLHVARRRELPSADVVLVVNLGPPLRVRHPRQTVLEVPTEGGFVAGLHESYAVTDASGAQRGVEIRLTPIGAYLLLGQPMDALANRVVGLDALLGRWTSDLTDRLRAAPTWAGRFALLDAAFGERLASARPPAPGVVWAWRQLMLTDGRTEIGPLATELGWSPKHLIARFRQQVGLPPKTVAQILRFQRAIDLLAGAPQADWAEIAQRCGYFDQSHLARDFRRFADSTPGELLRRRLPEGGGFAED